MWRDSLACSKFGRRKTLLWVLREMAYFPILPHPHTFESLWRLWWNLRLHEGAEGGASGREALSYCGPVLEWLEVSPSKPLPMSCKHQQ